METDKIFDYEEQLPNFGPNGDRIGYSPNGDKVVWVQDEDEDGRPIELPILLHRNEDDIVNAFNEYRDKVWWNHHHRWLQWIMTCKESLTEEKKTVLDQAKQAACKIEQKYGKETLLCDGFELGLLSGRMSRLSWVLGAEWDESLDT